MIDIHETRNIVVPDDPGIPAREEVLTRLGLGRRPEPEFDAAARRLAESAHDLSRADDPPAAMVNFVWSDLQYFAGLFAPEGVGRTMGRDQGWCPYVARRGKALVLDDVCDYPRFAANPVMDQYGIRSYVGAPLVARDGVVLGTVCFIDTEPRRWSHEGLDLIKSTATQVMGLIEQRVGRPV
jgi:GAF domain-containing protein